MMCPGHPTALQSGVLQGSLHHPGAQQHQVTFPEPQPCASSVLGPVTYLFTSSACPPSPSLLWTLGSQDLALPGGRRHLTSLGFLDLTFDNVEGNL